MYAQKRFAYTTLFQLFQLFQHGFGTGRVFSALVSYSRSLLLALLQPLFVVGTEGTGKRSV